MHISDNVNDHKTKVDATCLKMKIKRYAIEKEICLHYAFEVIVSLFTIIIAMFGFLNTLDNLYFMLGMDELCTKPTCMFFAWI